MIPVIPHEEETSDSTMETHSKLHDVRRSTVLTIAVCKYE